MLKIYIANLGKYNEGELVGEWLTLPTTDEELQELYVSIKAAHYDENGNFIQCGQFKKGQMVTISIEAEYGSDLPSVLFAFIKKCT